MLNFDPRCGPILPPEVMISTILNLPYLRMLSHKFQLSWLINYWEEDFKKISSIYSYVKLWPPIVAHPTHGGHDFHNLESTLPKNAFTQVSALLADEFLRRTFLKIYSIYSYVKLRPHIVAPPYPRGSWFSQLWIYTTWGCFHTSFSFSDQSSF